MKVARLVRKFNALFSSYQRRKEQQRTELEAALSKLRKKQQELQQALLHCHDAADKQELEEKISILTVQETKGLELLRELD